MDVKEEVSAVFGATGRRGEDFRMSLQSGCERVLAGMHRWYRAEHYARRVELIRERLPEAGIGADVIAGFPGETDAEHAETVGVIERLPVSYLHGFSCSQGPGARAAEIVEHVAM